MLWNFERVPGTVEPGNPTWSPGTPWPNLEPWNRTWNLGTPEPGPRFFPVLSVSPCPPMLVFPMLPSWPRLRRSAAASLTLFVCLALSSDPAAVRSESPAQAQQNDVVSSLERYAKGEYDDAVKQLIGTRTVSSVLRAFRKDADDWINRAAAPERTQRTAVVGAMSLELLAATFNQHRDEYVKTREIIEWACERFRRLPASEVERQFHLAGIALAQGAGDKRFIDGYQSSLNNFMPLGSHPEHPTERFPREARFKLAIATANPEVQQIATWPLPPGYLVAPSLLRIEHQYEREIINDSLQMLSELFDDPAVGAEARLRSGVLRFVREDVTVAGTDLEYAEQASDPGIRHLAHLMLGTIADQAGDSGEALRRYRLAYDTAPAATASVALASRLFRSGVVDEAAAVLRDFNSAPPPPDPWELYGQRDFRSFSVIRHGMRKAVAGTMGRPLPADLPDVPRREPLTLATSRAPSPDSHLAVLVQSGGEPVPDLTAADFQLFDNGVLQEITAIERETKALDVIVVAPEVTTTRSGKHQTFDAEIAAVTNALGAADRLTVMLAGRDPRPFTPPGSRDLLQEAALEQRCIPVYDTLSRALMEPVAPDRQRVVILMTSGEGRGGFLSMGPAAEIARRANARVYVTMVEPYQRPGNYIAQELCPAVSMDFGKEREDRLRYLNSGEIRTGEGGRDQMMRLTAIAESTGGREVKSSVLRNNAAGPLRDMLDEVRASYVLRYTPQGVPQSGWHPITVKVTKPGRYDVRARPGFER
jgi:VWFA-related protein